MATLKNNQFLLTFLLPILLTTPHYTMATTIASLCLKHYHHTSDDSDKKQTSLFKKYVSLQEQRTGFNSLYLLTEFLNEELLHIENDYNVVKSRIQLYGSDELLKMAISKAQSTTENILKKIPLLKKEIAETRDNNHSEELNSTISKCHEDLKLCRAALSLSLRESNEFFKFIDPLLEATEKQKIELKNLQKNLLQATNNTEESELSSQIIEQRILRISSLQKVILNFKTELSQSIDTAVSLKDMTLPEIENLLRSLKSEEFEISLTSISKLTKSFKTPMDRSAESLEFLTEPGKEFLSFLEKYNNAAFSPAISEKFRQIFLKDPKNNEFQRLSLADAKKILTLVTNSNISLSENSRDHFTHNYAGYVFYALNNFYSGSSGRLTETITQLHYSKDMDYFTSYIRTSVVPQINSTIENILLLFKLLDVTYTSSLHPIVEQYFAFAQELLSEQKNKLENTIKQKKTNSSKLKNLFTSTDETIKKAQLKIVFIETLITHLETLKKINLDDIQRALDRHQIPLFTIENSRETIPASVNHKAMEVGNEKP